MPLVLVTSAEHYQQALSAHEALPALVYISKRSGRDMHSAFERLASLFSATVLGLVLDMAHHDLEQVVNPLTGSIDTYRDQNIIVALTAFDRQKMQGLCFVGCKELRLMKTFEYLSDGQTAGTSGAACFDTDGKPPIHPLQ